MNLTFDIVREICLALPHVEEGTMYGSPALKVHGKLLAGLPVNKSAEPGSLGICMDFERRTGLLAEAPETYYLPDHYKNHPVVLVRLSQIGIDQLRDLLKAAWRFATSQTQETRKSRNRTTRKQKIGGK